jgi:CBS domain containing-hemolysin-like protein
LFILEPAHIVPSWQGEAAMRLFLLMLIPAYGVYLMYHPDRDLAWQHYLGITFEIGPVVVLICGAIIAVMFYMIPASVAAQRKSRIAPLIFFLNIAFGWTLLGWFLCLILAATSTTMAHDNPPVPLPPADPRATDAYARELARLDFEARQSPPPQQAP